jgi:hypothetical protein
MMVMNERADEGRTGRAKAIVLSLALGIVVLFAAGMIAGVATAILDDGEVNWRSSAIVVGLALLGGGGAVWGIGRLKPWAGPREQVAPRIRKANTLLLLAGGLGGAIGGVLALSTVSADDPLAMFSNAPLPPAVALAALAAWLVAMLLSLQWHRTVDEHEAETYEFGGLVALYLYTMLAPAWWLGWRGGLLPAPDAMAIFGIVMAAWGVAWFWRRSR